MTRMALLPSLALLLPLVVAGSAALPSSVAAFSTTPTDPCAQHKRGSNSWKKCRRDRGLSTSHREVEAFVLGYSLGKAGQYEDALKVLRPHATSNDPKILTYIGFAERHLGNIDVAMTYYERALHIDPSNAATLSYLGEAHLQRGEREAAQELLGKIESLCGSACIAYERLNVALERSDQAAS